MAAMTYTDIPDGRRRAGRNSYLLDTGNLPQIGSLVGLLAGVMVPWADTAGMTFLGTCLDLETSHDGIDGIAVPGSPEGIVNQNGDEIIVPTIGGSPAIGADVHSPSDNWRTDLTTAAGTNVKAIGWISGGAAGAWKVQLYTPHEQRNLA